MSGGPLFLNHVIKRVIDHVTDDHREIKHLKRVIENHKRVLHKAMEHDEHCEIQVGECDNCSKFYTYSLFGEPPERVYYCECGDAICEDCSCKGYFIMCDMCLNGWCHYCSSVTVCDGCKQFFCDECKQCDTFIVRDCLSFCSENCVPKITNALISD